MMGFLTCRSHTPARLTEMAKPSVGAYERGLDTDGCSCCWHPLKGLPGGGGVLPTSSKFLEELAAHTQQVILLLRCKQGPLGPTEWRAHHLLRYKSLIREGLKPEEPAPTSL
jgi:hypothetical protein